MVIYLNDFLSTYIISLILHLGLRSLKYLLSGPLRKTFQAPGLGHLKAFKECLLNAWITGNDRKVFEKHTTAQVVPVNEVVMFSS